MSKDMYDMLFDRIPHKNKYILEPKEIADYILYLEGKINQLTNNWQRLDNYLQRMLKVSVGEYKKAIQETIYMVNMLKEIKENDEKVN